MGRTLKNSKSSVQSQAVNREPLTLQAARLIRAAILNGEYGLGERLIEFDLAERFKIGRHVVREALQILEGEQLVISDAFRGRSVIRPSGREIEGILLLRVSLECVAASLAAYRISAEDSRRLREQAKISPGSFANLGGQNEWDSEIHRLIWRIADEPMLTSQLEKLISPTMILAHQLHLGEERALSVEELMSIENDPKDPRGHRMLIDAICCQNPSAARQAMVLHLTQTRGSREMRDLLRAAFGA
ncbi:MAG: GntR family transcriptional regulator [Acidobacteriota bacterium]